MDLQRDTLMRMIGDMTAAERWQLLCGIARRNPGLVYDAISRSRDRQPVRILALRLRPPRHSPPPVKDTEAAA